jgi:hypothetical protein
MCYLARNEKGPTLHNFKQLKFMRDLAKEIREFKAQFKEADTFKDDRS